MTSTSLNDPAMRQLAMLGRNRLMLKTYPRLSNHPHKHGNNVKHPDTKRGGNKLSKSHNDIQPAHNKPLTIAIEDTEIQRPTFTPVRFQPHPPTTPRRAAPSSPCSPTGPQHRSPQQHSPLQLLSPVQQGTSPQQLRPVVAPPRRHSPDERPPTPRETKFTLSDGMGSPSKRRVSINPSEALFPISSPPDERSLASENSERRVSSVLSRVESAVGDGTMLPSDYRPFGETLCAEEVRDCDGDVIELSNLVSNVMDGVFDEQRFTARASIVSQLTDNEIDKDDAVDDDGDVDDELLTEIHNVVDEVLTDVCEVEKHIQRIQSARSNNI